MPMIAGGDSSQLLARRDQESTLPAREEPFLCFQRRARGDVVLLPSNAAAAMTPISTNTFPGDRKVLGSAQRRYRGAILQHGSLLLNASSAAPELAGLGDLIGLAVSAAEVSNRVSSRLTSALGLQMTPAALPPNLELISRELANSKYGAAAWTNRR
jgi:lipoate-protein ligase A